VGWQGMGEPLSNYEAVRAAVLAMTDSERFGLGRAHVTVSTVGVVPRIRQLATDLPGVSLALSLHAPDQSLRASLVPSARAYPLDRIMSAVRDYQAASRQKVPSQGPVCQGSGGQSPGPLGRLRVHVQRLKCSFMLHQFPCGNL
jgi:adenine C2-methylase RlmN of 23S rRNA A2503 and tRNA A37